MAVFLNNGVVLTVDGVDLSEFVTSATLNLNYDELEVTSMGSTGHEFVKGLEANSITIDFLNDNGNSGVLATLVSNWGDSVTVTVKNSSAATSAGNPLFTMSCLVNGLTPVNGAVADLSTQSVTWTVNGAVTKAIS